MTWLLLGAGLAVLLYLKFQRQATPLWIYPSLAASTTQQASTAGAPPVVPTPQYSSVQQQEVAALYAQCAGSPTCSIVVGDTQLGI
jgi:hypothetical protein